MIEYLTPQGSKVNNNVFSINMRPRRGRTEIAEVPAERHLYSKLIFLLCPIGVKYVFGVANQLNDHNKIINTNIK
ncbi:MAG: hypothetical protein A3F72_16710 [Bacteroidetes bacterium RIFCSPLOWO2_12_FULL_35_15]|nr:MAG: hypothetical protein A3F72_16710 [Bacteroidetes bacterium RIFCSPLOWO2_12_FULL_35_15]